MCHWKSFIATKNGDIYHSSITSSHEDLIECFGFNDSKLLGQFIRIELTPNNNEYDNIDSYVFKVDEENTPEWFDVIRNKVEKRCRNVIKRMILKNVEINLLLEGEYIIAGKSVIKNVNGSNIIAIKDDSSIEDAYGNCRIVNASGNCRIENAYDNCRIVNAYGNCRIVNASDNCRIERAYENCRIEHAYGNCRIENAYDNCRIVNAYGNCIIEDAFGDCRIVNAFDNCRIERAFENCKIEYAFENCKIEHAYGNAKIINDNRIEKEKEFKSFKEKSKLTIRKILNDF